MEKKRLDKKKIKNANQNFKKNFFETDDDNHLSGYEVFYIFMICNVIGYCVEMVFCYLKHGYWESRQSLIYGPFGLAYGLGGVLLSYLLFKDTKKAWWKVFIKSYIWGTVAEYICSLGEELVFGHVSWDYSKMPLNINGRVCALYSVFWGIMGLVWVKLIYPLFMKLIHKIPLKIGKVLFWIMFILILIDIILSCEAVSRRNARDKWRRKIALSSLWISTIRMNFSTRFTQMPLQRHDDAAKQARLPIPPLLHSIYCAARY